MAHWAYKEGITKKIDPDKMPYQIDWFRDLIDLQDDSKNASEFVESAKEDIFKDKVYVFTPKGDVVELPSGALLDFAYNIHTEIGHKTIGAKVNGKIGPFELQTAEWRYHRSDDITELIRSEQDWVNLVSTSKAKNKIKRYFKLQDRDEHVIKGRDMLEKQLTEKWNFHQKNS